MCIPIEAYTATCAAKLLKFYVLCVMQGSCGSFPSASTLLSRLPNHHVYLYCGHGAGQAHVRLSRLESLPALPTCLLMGCSSARVHQPGYWHSDVSTLTQNPAASPGNLRKPGTMRDRSIAHNRNDDDVQSDLRHVT